MTTPVMTRAFYLCMTYYLLSNTHLHAHARTHTHTYAKHIHAKRVHSCKLTSSALKNLVWKNAEKNNEKSSMTFAWVFYTMRVWVCCFLFTVYSFVFNFLHYYVFHTKCIQQIVPANAIVIYLPPLKFLSVLGINHIFEN